MSFRSCMLLFSIVTKIIGKSYSSYPMLFKKADYCYKILLAYKRSGPRFFVRSNRFLGQYHLLALQGFSLIVKRIYE